MIYITIITCVFFVCLTVCVCNNLQLKANKEKESADMAVISAKLHRIENLIDDYDDRISELTVFADETNHDVKENLGIIKEFDKKLDDIKRI